MDLVETPSRRARPVRMLVASAFALLSGAATAALPPAGVAGTVSFNLLTPPPIDVGAFGSDSPIGPSGGLHLDAAPMPGPFAFRSAQVAPFAFGRASAVVQYSVQVAGPAPTLMVDIQVAGGVAGSSSPGGAPGDIFNGFAMKSMWNLEDPASGTLISEGIETPSLQGSFSDGFSHAVQLVLAVGSL